jgi:hypothetical protein
LGLLDSWSAGLGTIQIANANRIIVKPQNQRKGWMLQLCEELFEYYPREIAKITDRMEYFKKVEEFWKKKVD